VSGATDPTAVADAELLGAYAATTWWLRLPAGDLPLRVGTPLTAPVSFPAAVVTAYNPASRPCRPAANRASDRRLRERLRSLGLQAHAVLARAPGAAREWDEPGHLVVGVDLGTALRLGREFAQNAIVWIGEDRLPILLATRPGFCGAAVGDRPILRTPAPQDRDAGS
jgi:hypothetical protein